jgi:hypothetical protein
MCWAVVRRRGVNPWHAGTLDWATESPPPDEGYRVFPIVHTRSPLWEQASLEEGDPETVRLVHVLEQSPTDYRATLVTSLVEGIPEGVVRIASAPASSNDSRGVDPLTGTASAGGDARSGWSRR